MRFVLIAEEAFQLPNIKLRKNKDDLPLLHFFNEAEYHRRRIIDWESQVTYQYNNWEGNRID